MEKKNPRRGTLATTSGSGLKRKRIKADDFKAGRHVSVNLNGREAHEHLDELALIGRRPHRDEVGLGVLEPSIGGQLVESEIEKL